MKHKVYAFMGEIPFGLIDEFRTRKEAKACKLRVERDGIKQNNKFVEVNAKIVVS